MAGRLVLIGLTLTVFAVLCGLSPAEEPVKWSLPMNNYPNQWAPSTPPPEPNQYGGQNPQGDYWNGYGYQGSPQPQTTYPGWYQPQTGAGFSGNPYYYGR
jgi:hypothetical protein